MKLSLKRIKRREKTFGEVIKDGAGDVAIVVPEGVEGRGGERLDGETRRFGISFVFLEKRVTKRKDSRDWKGV